MARYKVLAKDFFDLGIHEQRGADPCNILADLDLAKPGNVCAEKVSCNDFDYIVWNYAKDKILFYLINVDKAVNVS